MESAIDRKRNVPFGNGADIRLGMIDAEYLNPLASLDGQLGTADQ
jgi:hypothetical protein